MKQTCINDELIQRYIDRETGSEESARIEKHAADCPQCARNIEEQKSFSDYFKREIGQWKGQPDTIPEFVAPVTRKRELNLQIKRYLYAISAACAILLLIVLLFPKQSKEKDIQLIYSFDGDFDANRTVSQQEMEIIMIDSEGKVVKYN